ncbi:M1 family metallopeptidase [Panacibacter ginsenosidivorans]|uniref:Aminopeptidase N n=1 Tax=Panacibacter ginsenosidivorans TaxID=1813871 RepID=A0A5B8V9I8_9BACT|nr:M1 family metallopeptidase [Panacibacter ginsenosidivorans]QEC68084.1 M1 family metallopeptidase [Panacibacter ginsenosidivorans]
MRLTCLFLFVFFVDSLLAQSTFTSGGKLRPEQAVMDIRHYTIALDVDVQQHTIRGYTIIDVDMLQPTSILLFDLLDSFNIKSITVNDKNQKFVYKNNLITINLSQELPAGKAAVKIEYNGKPHVAIRPPWDDGFTWTKDSSGHPWIAVTAEGTGGKLYYPCKDHPSDEPNEGVDLTITVPKDLVVAGPGLLQKITKKRDKATYYWKTNYTINNYSIVFNIGNYKVVSKNYITINDNTVPMQFYVLQEHAAMAEHHLDVFEQSMHVQEKYFGEYPWIKEKIGIAETPHLGMEHQTMNAYGNKFRYTKIGGKDFDWLMHHELGHEWWGNKITAKDWADYWIHEGICSFGDALYTREMEGEAAYIKWFKNSSLHFENKQPIVIGKDIDEEQAYHADIYGKGAFFMHTLRYVLGDSIFFPTLKQFATNAKYNYDNLVNTDDVEQFFSKTKGTDLKPLFNLYLRTTNKLEILVKRTGLTEYNVSLGNIDMALPLDIATTNGLKKAMINKKGITIKSSTLPVIDPDMFYLTKIIIE